jgi:hypothetical protein
MFESVRPDPGQEGLTKAARIFFVLAVLCVIVALLEFAIAVASRESPPLRSVIINFVLAAAAVAIGNSIEKQRPWAKWLGFAFAALELLNFPIGTVIGIALIVYLYRASKAGLL